jgi:hypothetical protein
MFCIASLQKQCEALEGCCSPHQLAVWHASARWHLRRPSLSWRCSQSLLTLGWCLLPTWVFVTKAGGCLASLWCVCGFGVPCAIYNRVRMECHCDVCRHNHVHAPIWRTAVRWYWLREEETLWHSWKATWGRQAAHQAEQYRLRMLVQPQREMPSGMADH